MTEITPQAITFTEIQKEQNTFLDSKVDSDVWLDRYNHSSGTIELELNSVISAHLLRRIVFERREAYLREAKKHSSVIALANNLGYSAKRPRNARIRVKILPNQTITLNKFDSIGSLKDVEMLVQNTTTLVSGIVTTVDCIIGNLKTASLTAKSDKLDLFRFIEQDVSQDIRLNITNGSTTQEISYSEKILDLENDKFVVITNPFISIDLMYLNNPLGQYYYNTGSTIDLEYIEANNLDFDLANTAQVNLYYGQYYPSILSPTIGDTQVLESYRDLEDILSIAINAPLNFESQSKIRGREDFRKNFAILGGGSISDTNGRDLSPAEVELTYLKIDKTLLTTNEKNAYLASLNAMTNYGVWLKQISDPFEVSYRFNITLKQYLGSDISEVNNNIIEIFAYEHKESLSPTSDNRLKKREMKLEYKLDLNQLEHEIVRIEHSRTKKTPIQIARIELYTTDYQNSTAYIRGNFVKHSPDNGFIYECVKNGTSGVSTVSADFPTTANELFIENMNTWQPNTNYNIGDFVQTDITPSPYVFKCMIAGQSGTSEPSWNNSTAENITTIDNQVTWKAFLPLDISGFLIWKAHLPNVRELPVQWNEHISLSYGTALIWA